MGVATPDAPDKVAGEARGKVSRLSCGTTERGGAAGVRDTWDVNT